MKATLLPSGRYSLLWGQRRVLAARKAGLATIPALVYADEPDDRPIEQLVENLHRADLNPIDRARAMRAVVDAGVSQADLARKLGIAPSTVANDLGLLDAPAPVQALLESTQLTPAHVKAMKGLAPKTQVELAKEVVDRGYSAHRTEVEVQDRKRRADAERQHEQKQVEARAAKREAAVASIADWEKKKVPKDALIVVASGYSYGDSGSSGHIVKLIEGAGYTNVRPAKSWDEIHARPGGDLCDCTAWKAAEHTTYSYASGRSVETYRVSISKGCIERKHRQAKESASDAVRREKEALATKVQQHVKRTAAGWAIPEGRAIAIDRILAEAALWGLLSYRIPTWAEAHGGKKNNPFAAIHALTDEDLAKELAMEIANDFRDKAGYHVNWPELAAELGVEP